MANVWLKKKLQLPEFILLVAVLYRTLQCGPLFFETNIPHPPGITGGKQWAVRVSKDSLVNSSACPFKVRYHYDHNENNDTADDQEFFFVYRRMLFRLLHSIRF